MGDRQTTRLTTRLSLHSVNEHLLPGAPATVGALLDQLASPADGLWPHHRANAHRPHPPTTSAMVASRPHAPSDGRLSHGRESCSLEPLERREVHRSRHDWFMTWVADGSFPAPRAQQAERVAAQIEPFARVKAWTRPTASNSGPARTPLVASSTGAGGEVFVP